jgi:hypothetical protein
MEARQPSLIAYLDDTSATKVSAVVSEQLDELFGARGRVEWHLEPSLPFTGKVRSGTEVPAMCDAVKEAVRSNSNTRFVPWRIRASVAGFQEEWVFAVADELVPHLHLQLDRLNSAIDGDDERLIAKACRDVVQRGFADFCWDAKTFCGDKVSLYAYFKLQAVRKRQPSLSARKPGWEHGRFVENLRRTLASLGSDVAGSVNDVPWNELLASTKAIDAFLSSDANKRMLEGLLKPLECSSEAWLNAG